MEEEQYCPNCGSKKLPNNIYCHNCGKKIVRKNNLLLNHWKIIIIILFVFLLLMFLSAHMSRVQGNSMIPVIQDNDIVIVKNVNFWGIQEFNPFTDLKVRDIIIYDAEWYDGEVIGRIIDVQVLNGSKYYTIKGDNNNVSDPYLVSPQQIRSLVINK